MGFLSNPLEPEQAASISHAFLQGAAQQASVNATQSANDREDQQTALAAKQAQIDAVAAKTAATSTALSKAKADAAKLNFEKGEAFLTPKIQEDQAIVNNSTGLNSSADQLAAKTRMEANIANLTNFNQNYAKFTNTLAVSDPLQAGDFTFDPKKSFLPPAQPAEIGPKEALSMAQGNASLTHTNLESAKLLGGGSEKLSEAQKNSRKAEDDFNGNANDVNTKLDLFNTEQAKYNHDVATKNSKASPDEMLGPAGGLLNSYRGFWNGIQQGRYDDLDPNMRQVATVVQQNVGANWNHPRAASQQLDVLSRYFLNNPKASPEQKNAAKKIYDAIQTRAPQLEAATPYYNQIEAPPK